MTHEQTLNKNLIWIIKLNIEAMFRHIEQILREKIYT